MKILMLNYEFPPIGGGAGKANLCLLHEYAKCEDLQVDVLTSAPKPGFVEEVFSDNIRIFKVGIRKQQLHYWRKSEVMAWLLKTRRHYYRLVRENQYDLSHAFFAFPTGWFCYRDAAKLPYIISLRGSDVPGYNMRLGLDYKLLSGLFRRIWSKASIVVANSKGLRSLAFDFMPDLDIKVIPNGIDTEKFYPSQKPDISKPLQMLTVCRLIGRKRIDLLIRATAHASKLGLDVQLNIAGYGNLLDPLQSLANELDIADKVIFMGRIPSEQMPQLYRDNDIFVMSSAHEGMSNAMLEAMASGLPIITTECEGVEELIADNGIIVQTANPEDFTQAIKQIAENRDVYERMSTAARKRANEFNWNTVATDYLELYKTVCRTKEVGE